MFHWPGIRVYCCAVATASGLKKIALLYFDAGGGHRAAAQALQRAIALQQRPWDVCLVNLQEILLPLDPFRRLLGLNLQEIYNQLLRRGFTLGAPQLLKLLHGLIRLRHRALVQCLGTYWQARPFDLVVSLVPNFNRAIHQSVRQAMPGVPSVTILTDLADYPPHFWIEPDTPAVICGTPCAAAQAAAVGLPPERIYTVSGMILDPRLYDGDETATAPRSKQSEVRAELGLQPSLATALVLFGGFGSNLMLTIVRRLRRARLPLQLILVCGHNARLERRLRRLAVRSPMPMRVEGFSRDIPLLMAAADFMIGKPGPGSLSEAVRSRLPLIVMSNAWTLPQERYNAAWIREHELGLVVRSFRRIAPAARRLLDENERARMRARAAAFDNRAVWEIPEILARRLASVDG